MGPERLSPGVLSHAYYMASRVPRSRGRSGMATEVGAHAARSTSRSFESWLRSCLRQQGDEKRLLKSRTCEGRGKNVEAERGIEGIYQANKGEGVEAGGWSFFIVHSTSRHRLCHKPESANSHPNLILMYKGEFTRKRERSHNPTYTLGRRRCSLSSHTIDKIYQASWAQFEDCGRSRMNMSSMTARL